MGATRRRILILGINYAPERTGIAPYTAGMARAIARDHDVAVVTTHPHYPSWALEHGHGGWRRSVVEDGVDVTRLAHYIPADPTGAGRILSEASFAMRTMLPGVRRPDAVIAVTPALLPVASARVLARRWRIPVGVVVQDVYSAAIGELGLLGGRADGAVRSLESWLLGGADGVVTIHERMKIAIELQLGLSPEKVKVIPNWTHVAAPSGDRARERALLGWGRETVVLHAGNMGAKQGLEHVIRAGETVDRGGPPIRFVLLGDGSQRDYLEREARDVESVDFMSPVDNDRFSDVLAAADVLLLHERPGVEEMCVPSKLTSYFASGRPVLAATSTTSAAAYEVRKAGAGIVTPAGDARALISAVGNLSSMDLDELGVSGLRYAQTVLSEEVAFSSYRSWVDDLLVSGSGNR